MRGRESFLLFGENQGQEEMVRRLERPTTARWGRGKGGRLQGENHLADRGEKKCGSCVGKTLEGGDLPYRWSLLAVGGGGRREKTVRREKNPRRVVKRRPRAGLEG